MDQENLKEYNGESGKPTYIAYKGKIYDVSQSKLWKNGKHMTKHSAGEDLTDFLALAPHTEKVFEKFKVVEEIEVDKEKVELDLREKLRRMYEKFHPHPVLVHFPIAGYFFSAILQFLYLVSGFIPFALSAVYILVFSILGTLFAIPAGILSWGVNYNFSSTPIFKYKFRGSIALSIISIVEIIILLMWPDLNFSVNFMTYVYNCLIFINVPVVLSIAYEGGKITWG